MYIDRSFVSGFSGFCFWKSSVCRLEQRRQLAVREDEGFEGGGVGGYKVKTCLVFLDPSDRQLET